MPRNGSGSYVLPSGNPVTTATTISSTVQNNTSSDIATALTASLAKDGQTVPTANLPMGGYKHTGAAAGSARTDYATISNIQDGTGFYVGTVGGTVDVITLTNSPALTSYSAGQMFSFISSGANTTNVTVNISALGAKAITKNGATALVAGDIPASALVVIQYDGTQFQLVTVNVNPLSSITGLGTGVATALAVSLANGGGFAPTGTLLDFAGTAAPTGFLGCDGAAISRTTYAALFTAIGTTWGVGDGATTFNVPNFQRRVAVGSGGSGTATLANTVGSTGGAETHTLTTPEIPAHTHGISNGAGDGAGGAGGSFASANASVQSTSTGGGGSHNNMQPSAVVLKIIKT
jgi:microcystin-dependent protein